MTNWQRSDEWIGSQIDDSFVMINLEHGSYVALNATAATAWDLLAEPRSEDMLVDAMVEKFAVDANHCRDAVGRLLVDMTARGLIRTVS